MNSEWIIAEQDFSCEILVKILENQWPKTISAEIFSQIAIEKKVEGEDKTVDNEKWFSRQTLQKLSSKRISKQTNMICNHRVRLKSEHLFLDGDKPSLLETIFKYLANNLNLISQLDPTTNKWELKDDVIIPNEICDR